MVLTQRLVEALSAETDQSECWCDHSLMTPSNYQLLVRGPLWLDFVRRLIIILKFRFRFGMPSDELFAL